MSDLAEARLAVQHDLSRVFALSRDVREAAPEILSAVGRGLGSVVGEMWVADVARPVLTSVGAWTKSDRFGAFVEANRSFEFQHGRGLPGLAWERAAPQWISDVTSDDVFLRRLPAVACDVHAAVAFPIVFGGAVTGVIQFFFAEKKEPDDALVDMFADIGEQLGLFLERARIDGVALEQAREILELSAPILRVGRRVLLLPIIGNFDARRAVAATERLLEHVTDLGAGTVILDLTSAGTMDTFMAQRLLDAIAAVKLLGAEVVLTGVRPTAARALVLLGIPIDGVRTYTSLSEGLAKISE